MNNHLEALGIFLIWVAGYMVTAMYRIVHTQYPVRIDDFLSAVFVGVLWPIAVPIIWIGKKLGVGIWAR
jgi:hypothetical protein